MTSGTRRPRIRVGVIGAGAWATTVQLPPLVAEPDVDLVVVNRRDGDLARQIAERFGAARWTTDWQEVVSMDLDAVVVASPAGVHREQVVAALEAGTHVLCEKPFAIRSADAWAMADAARRADRSLLVAFGWNHMPLVQAARRLLDEGPIGRVESVVLSVNVATRELLLHGTTYNSAVGGIAPRAETFVDPAMSGGGTAPVTMSHAFGMALFLTRLDALDIHCRTLDTPSGIDLHDVMTVGFRGGAIGAFSGSSSHESVPQVQWHVGIVGEGGQLLLDSDTDTVRFAGASGEVRDADLGVGAGRYEPAGPVRELIAVCRGGSPSDASPATLGARTVELVEGALASAASGRVEPVPRDRPTWFDGLR